MHLMEIKNVHVIYIKFNHNLLKNKGLGLVTSKSFKVNQNSFDQK